MRHCFVEAFLSYNKHTNAAVHGNSAQPVNVASIYGTMTVRLCILSTHARVYVNARYKAYR